MAKEKPETPPTEPVQTPAPTESFGRRKPADNPKESTA